MKPATFDLSRASEANCNNASDAEIFFPQTAKAVKARKWEPYCSSCPIKGLCGDAVYDGFTGVAGGEFYGKLAREPEVKRSKPRKAQKLPRADVPRFNVALGSVVRRKRLEQGVTLRAFSAKVYLSISMISEFERGIVETNSASIAKIAEALNTPQSTLVRDAATEIERLEQSSRSKVG